MTAALLAQLLAQFGPKAFEIVSDLVKSWNKALTPEEVLEFCQRHRKSYDDYIAEAKSNLK